MLPFKQQVYFSLSTQRELIRESFLLTRKNSKPTHFIQIDVYLCNFS